MVTSRTLIFSWHFLSPCHLPISFQQPHFSKEKCAAVLLNAAKLANFTYCSFALAKYSFLNFLLEKNQKSEADRQKKRRKQQDMVVSIFEPSIFQPQESI